MSLYLPAFSLTCLLLLIQTPSLITMLTTSPTSSWRVAAAEDTHDRLIDGLDNVFAPPPSLPDSYALVNGFLLFLLVATLISAIAIWRCRCRRAPRHGVREGARMVLQTLMLNDGEE
ncbi:hypothetical protein PFISCL1PPCAC_7462 [Pristionchus fissidentatus]|uniref:Uncharacterized protein n=1 Tax=Pristionchus fissidentatus TaxID=1538716 RepID=A0AAV5VC93_9BILA|nr:hypothetical protein PFISCL1PPCAC_7462 [Pristionchus fissidentatus]